MFRCDAIDCYAEAAYDSSHVMSSMPLPPGTSCMSIQSVQGLWTGWHVPHCRQCLLHDCSVPRQGQSQYSRPVELSSYGDGLLWGAGLLLHLLNQTAWFKLTDLSALIVQRQQLEYRTAGGAVASAVASCFKGYATTLHSYSFALIMHVNHSDGSTTSVMTIAQG